MKLGGYFLLAIPAVICLGQTTSKPGEITTKAQGITTKAQEITTKAQEITTKKDVNMLSCEAGRNLREDVTSLQDTVTSLQDTLTDMQATVNNQSDVIASILANLEAKEAAALSRQANASFELAKATSQFKCQSSRYDNPCANRSRNSCTNCGADCGTDCKDGWGGVIQRRMNGEVDFYRNWEEYERGFGDVTGDFWIGLDKIHRLTSSQNYSLRVDLEDWDGSKAYAEYRDFSISGPDDFYRLHISGYSNTSDSMIQHKNQNNMQFSTPDQDHDKWSGSCARSFHGAWWFQACSWVNPNGRYINVDGIGVDGIAWYHWKHDGRSLKHVEMKIRPQE
nr:hypothetical protein BaRGS_008900 [Batillaria attramentaria]